MTKQFFAIIGLLFFGFTSFAQLSVTPYIQGDFSHYFFLPDESEKMAAKTYKDRLRPKLGYTFGINIDYAFNDKWSLQMGLMYQELGERFPKEDFLSNTQNQSFVAYKITHHYQFLSIPVQAKYTFNQGKLSPYVALGTAVNFLTNGFINSTTYNAEDVGTTTKIATQDLDGFDVRPLNFSTKMDVGLNYPLTEKLNLNTFISGNLLLLNTLENHIYNPRNFNIGLGFGLGYSI